MFQQDRHIFFTAWDLLGPYAATPIKTHGHSFPTAEHLYTYLKAIFYDDIDTAQRVLRASTPLDAHILAKCVEGYSEQSWSSHIPHIIKFIINHKSENKDIFNILSKYNDCSFVYCDPHDGILGCGQSINSIINEGYAGRGTNYLGEALTKKAQEILIDAAFSMSMDTLDNPFSDDGFLYFDEEDSLSRTSIFSDE